MKTLESVQVEEPAGVSPEPTVGEILRAAREAQNTSVMEVANRLKLSIQQVEALERGAYEVLPGPVFVRGFIRNYARMLRLDPDALLPAVEADLPRAGAGQPAGFSEARIPMPAGSSGRWRLLAGFAAVVFLGAALIDVLWPEAPPSPDAAPPAAELVATPVEPQASALPEPPAALAAVEAPGSLSTDADDVGSRSATGPMPAAYRPDTPSPGRALRLVFEQESWVRISDASGKVVLEDLYRAGTSREITAEPPLTLVIGNASGVRLTYGDRAIDLAPHTRVAVARLTLK